MIKLTCDKRQLLCCDAMLQHDTFVLIPDIDTSQWLVYSEAKYLLLEQKLLALNTLAGVDSNSRLGRILLGNCIVLKRQGKGIPLTDSLLQLTAGSLFYWKPD
mgnify:CR=1 FL=1